MKTLLQHVLRLDRYHKEHGATRFQQIIMLAERALRMMFPFGLRFPPSLRVGFLFLIWAYNNVYGYLLPRALRAELDLGTGDIGEQEPLVFSEHTSPRCSILVPVFGEWRHTYACLRSILRHSGDFPYEVIVLDDCSPDETPRLPEIVQGVRFVRYPENLGFLGNCNAGAHHARGETLLLLNNGTRVQEGWLEALHAVLDEDPDGGVVGAKLIGADGRLQEAGGIVWRDGSAWDYGCFDEPKRPEYNYRKEVDYCSGACILVRRELWRALGGFDESFAPGYYADRDIAFAARSVGRKVVYQPRAAVVRIEEVSHGTDSGVKRYQEVNRVKFVEKWCGELAKWQFAGPDDLFRARDRSRTHPHVAVVDHQVPAWEEDAGSRLVFLYLKLLLDDGWRVTLVPHKLLPAQPYTDRLQDLGVEVLHGHWYGANCKRWFARYGRVLDAVFLHRPDVAHHYLPLARAHAPRARVIYQCHDLHQLREQRRWELEGRRGESPKATHWRTVEDRVLREVDVVHTPSTFERAWLKARFPGIVARDVPVFFYDHVPLDGAPREGGDLTTRASADLLFVGCFVRSANEDAALWCAREILPRIRSHAPRARLVLIGSPTYRLGELADLGTGVVVRGRVSDEELGFAYRSARLVIVPLRYGAGVKGKVVEALAWGTPVVTTSIGAEGIPGIEEAAAIADGPDAFATAVLRLISDDTAWRAQRAASLALVERVFSVERARAIIRADFTASINP